MEFKYIFRFFKREATTTNGIEKMHQRQPAISNRFCSNLYEKYGTIRGE